MPELPEVETIVRGLRRTIPGRTILSVRLGKTDFIDDPSALEKELPGQRIEAIDRHGKFILLKLSRKRFGARSPKIGGACDSAFIVHLGMTGHLSPRGAVEPLAPHTHVQLALDDGRELRYTDPRRFGRMLWLPAAQLPGFHSQLGFDALTISEEDFRQSISSRRARIKALFMDQHVFAGIGNIYADESLWKARIHPARLGSSLDRKQIRNLFGALQKTLRDAIRFRGSSISDYLDVEGFPGEYQQRHRVYQRAGKKCYRCPGIIRSRIVAGRTTHFCPRCQPAPRSPRRRRAGS